MVADMIGLDDFSRSFADALFAAVLSVRGYARSQNGRLLIDMKPGAERQDCEFWVSTAGEEITIGFGMFHAHFDWPALDLSLESDPIKFVQSVISDATLIEDWALDGEWSGSSILGAAEEPDLTDMKPGHVVHIRSWSGDRDRTSCAR